VDGELETSRWAAWRRPGWRWGAVLAVVLVVAAAIAAALAWHFSSFVLVPQFHNWPEDIRVERVGEGRITLERSEDTERPGLFGLDWQGGHAVVGEVFEVAEDSVTRRLRDVRGYLVAGMDVAIGPYVQVGDPRQAFGVRFSEPRVRGELGEMPAWLLPGRGDTWAIVVHGINSTPQDGLRIVPTLRRAGLPALLITYREDRGAPSSPDGFHHMGQTEWRDLAAAARFALSRGARRLVLVGYSMGGAVVAQFMQRSPLADRVAGLVLDAPVLDWRETFSFRASEMGLPSFAGLPVEWSIDARIDVDWDSLDAARHLEAFQLPILLFHGSEDDVVPISTSEEFAAALPRRVAYFRVPRAGHTEAWNVDPALYEERLERFLRPLAVDRGADGDGRR
jgi:uncharacterized protein